MPKLLKGLLILMVAVACVPGRTAAEQPFDPAGALVSAMTERLLLMEGVAQYKWNKAIPIEDLERERVVLDKVVASAEAQGVEVVFASDFFRAQITAAKAIQARLFETWGRDAVGSFPNAPDLKTELRPAIGVLTGRIIGSLAQLDEIDAEALCAALGAVPRPLAADAEAWYIAAAPVRERTKGCS